MESTERNFPWFTLVVLAMAPFMAIMAELAPPGILYEIEMSLAITKQQASRLVSFYALASAFGAIPIVSMSGHLPRKRLLLGILSVYMTANLLMGVLTNYHLMLLVRLLGGAFAGAFWPMLAAYAMKIVHPSLAGRAVTTIMTGATVGLIVGIPFATYVGQHFGWRFVFMLIAAIALIDIILVYFFAPTVEGEAPSKETSPFTVVKDSSVLKILALTVFSIMAHYAVYVYILDIIQYTSFTSVSTAQLLHGIGSALSMMIAGRFSDRYLKQTTLGIVSAGLIALTLIFLFPNQTAILLVAFVLWGMGYGALSPLYQATIARNLSKGQAVGNAIQSSAFNFAIMAGTQLGGMILYLSHVRSLLLFGILLLLMTAGLVLAFTSLYRPGR
ncbi:MFS transporter [Dolosicoccus paucivorans]|uniref:Major facilitator superfamily (MFS) profile domain-containing protein n=1 Tax=Dolosicoccus paucivorans TaxID=84521 RepID=A0A2N6SNQ7_9LACT|nr:MFS transporter [Dolosicoccus paucivorans]PMB84213.1 hypothetical protein CJ206_05110 [Dolosicoccus paucivorans]PMC58676.1 hypothetical protein CJ205_03130 [Dolosicoccus paucivorans]